MIKRQFNSINKSYFNRLEPRTATLFVGLILFMSIFLINFTSAFDWEEGNLISYYKFDETTGTVVTDSTGLTNAVNNASTIGISGKIGTAYNLLGTSSSNIAFPDNYMSSLNNGSISLWFKTNNVNAESTLFASFKLATNDMFRITTATTGVIEVQKFGGSNTGDVQGNVTLSNNTWNHIVVISNGASWQVFTNGQNNSLTISGANSGAWFNDLTSLQKVRIGLLYISGTPYYSTNMSVDELGIFNKTLNSTEVLELWNSGSGLAYGGETGEQYITLTYPTNATTLSTNGANFTANFIIDGDNINGYVWKNATFKVWKDNTQFNFTTVSLSGNNTNTTLFIDDFTLGNYKWNVLGWYGNGTYNNYTTATNNYTFLVTGFTEVNKSFSAYTTSVSLENFSIVINYNPAFFTSASGKLVYNGTKYESTRTGSGTQYTFSNRLTIPIVTIQENISFYWEFIFGVLGGGYVTINSSSNNQIINNLSIDSCTSNTYRILNYTLVDEDTNLIINQTLYNPKIDYDIKISGILNSNIYTQYSGTVNANNLSICLPITSNSSIYRLDSVIKYSSDDRVQRYNHLQNYLLSFATSYQNITLRDLNSSLATVYNLIYTTGSFIPQAGYVLEVQRYYTPLNSNNLTVETAITDTLGTAQVYLISNNAYYQVLAKLNGVIVDIFDVQQAKCQSLPCTIYLNSKSGIPTIPWITIGNNLEWDYSYNEDTYILNLNWTKLDGVSFDMILSQYYLNGTFITNNTASGAYGSIDVNLSSYIGKTINFYLYQDGDLIRTFSQKVIDLDMQIPEGVRPTLILLGAFFFLLIFIMGFTNNTLMLALIAIGVVLVSMLNIVISGFSLMSATLMGGSLIITIVLIAYKLNTRRNA